MKKKIFFLFSVFFVMFFAFPSQNVFADSPKRLDEVLGQYAMSMIGKANQNLKDVEKYIGTELVSRFKNRTNELNDIVNGALTVKGGDHILETWDKIVDFAFPVDDESVQITATPALKGAIADIVVNLPDEIKVSEGYKFLGKFASELGSGHSFVNVPFSYQYVKGVSPDYIYFKIVQVTNGIETSFGTSLRYENETYPFGSASFNAGNFEDKTWYTSVDLAYARENSNGDFKVTGLDFSTKGFREETVVDVYYSLGEVSAVPYNKTDIINNSFLNQNNTNVYNILNGQIGDNTTVTHNFDKYYKNFNDYGVSPDKNQISSGSGILSAILGFLGGIPKMITDFLEAMFGLFERIIAIFIPTAEQISSLGDSLSSIIDDFNGKFSLFIDLGDSLKGAFSSPSNIFDYSITLMDKSYPLIPVFLAGALGQVRVFLSGALVLSTFTSIYKRIVGSGDVIKS